MTTLQIGRLLRASTTGCVVGCRVTQINAPAFGGMVRIPLDAGLETQVYGLVYDIHIDDDGLVRQLITAEGVPEDVIQDNRVNRNVPVEVSVLFTGLPAPWAHLSPAAAPPAAHAGRHLFMRRGGPVRVHRRWTLRILSPYLETGRPAGG
jgi:hypothetical protein